MSNDYKYSEEYRERLFKDLDGKLDMWMKEEQKPSKEEEE